MKVGIVTQPLKNNYGGILQNYALQQILLRLGHNPITIDYRPENSFIRYLLAQCKTILLFFIPSRRRQFTKFRKTQSRFPQMSEFVSKHITTTRRLNYVNKHIVKKYELDAICCGSDQVWRPMYNDLLFTFLSFVKSKKIKRIAYAASFGVDKWEYTPKQTMKYSQLAQKFDAISVREKSGIALCKDYLNVNAVEVLDPTLLLTEEQYLPLCNTIPFCKKKIMFVYILDMTDKKRQFIERIAKEKNLEIHFFSADANLTASIDQWISSFRDACYVVTDSFHGTVFSIIFRKPFVSIVNKQRGGDRFVSLLSKLGLTDRMIDVEKDVFFHDYDINWTDITNILEEEQGNSIDFLKNILR